MTVFNQTIEVVTFRLRGWRMMGVFFVEGIHPSRTRMSGSLESVRWNACMHRLYLGLYSHPKEFGGNGVRTHVHSTGKKSPLPGKFSSEEDQTHDDVSSRTASPTHYQRAIPSSGPLESTENSEPNTLPTSYSKLWTSGVNRELNSFSTIHDLIRISQLHP